MGSGLSARSARDRTQNRLSLALDEARASGARVLDLTESNPTAAGVPYADGLLDALSDPEGLRYAPTPFGAPLARAAVARTYAEAGVDVDPDRVLLTSSTSEAYAYLFKLLCDPGDEVLVPQPSYPLLDHLAQLEGVRLVPYALDYDGAWYLDAGSLHRAVGPRSRAIVVVSPNNPTGSYLKRGELEILQATGLPIVSDEVFAGYGPFAAARARAATPAHAIARSALEGTGGLVFALGGLSKSAALPQMKLAWIAMGGPPAAVDEARARLELVADTFLSVSTPVQVAAPRLLASRGVAAGAIRARLEENLAVARASVRGSPASVLDVEGGWYATLRLPSTRTEEEWALALLREDRVYVHPGHFFDFPKEAYVVTSLLTPEARFAEGVGRIVARVS